MTSSPILEPALVHCGHPYRTLVNPAMTDKVRYVLTPFSTGIQLLNDRPGHNDPLVKLLE